MLKPECISSHSFIALLFCLSIPFCGSCQEKAAGNWLFKIDAPLLIDAASFPTLQLSAEKKITPQISIIAEAGVQLYRFSSTDTTFIRTRGFKVNLEGRYYFSKLLNRNRIPRHNGLFCGLQGFYRKNQEMQSISYSKYEGGLEYTDEFGIKKRISGFNITVGYQLSFKKNYFILEPHLGFGMMNRKIKNYNLQYKYSEDTNSNIHHFSGDSDFEVSSGTRFNFNIGLRLGIALK